MNRTEVKSSQVKSVGYDAEKQILEVEFKSRKEGEAGPVYQYSGFTPYHWTNFRQAESIGSHLHRFIKPNFACKKIEAEKEPEVQEKQESDPKAKEL